METLFRLSCLAAFLCGAALEGVTAERPKPGILDQEAPQWGVTRWLNLPPEKKTLDVEDYKGKVLYLYAFQSWCPGCHRYGFPTLQKVIKEFDGDEEVQFVAIQTTFEGFSSNGYKQAEGTALRYGLKIPVGQSGTEQERSAVMQRYRTGGTPWTIIIDRKGVVRFNDFHITPGAASRLIKKLKTSEE